MKKPSINLIIPIAVATIVGAGAIGLSAVSAANNPSSSSLVQKLSDTFHLDKSKVQAVFDQNKAEQQQNRETRYEARLTAAVTAGQLTEAQKQAVLAEHTKLMDELKAAKTGAKTDRRAAMQKVRQEATDWAKQNNVDAKWLSFGRVHGAKD